MLSGNRGSLAPGLAPHYVLGETLVSFASRLEARLGMGPEYLWSMASAQERQHVSGKIPLASIHLRLASICERMTGLPISTFPLCAPQQIAWHACRQCTGGLIAQLESGGGQLVCRIHQRWVGPSVVRRGLPPGRPAPPDGYHSGRVALVVLRAAAGIEGLLASHRVTPRLVDEVCARIASAKQRRYRGAPTPSDLPTVAALLSVLTDPELNRKLFNPSHTFRQAYATLADSIIGELPKAGWAVIDEAWLLLRPSFVWYRTTKLAEKGTSSFEPLLAPAVEAQPAIFPLEPMGRYMLCLNTYGRPDNQWWLDRFLVQQSDPQARELLICRNGHVQSASKDTVRRGNPKDFHCSICTGQRVVAGYNSLGDLMPQLAIEWDREANGNLTPFMVSPGSNRKVAWKDALGHTYETTVANRTGKGSGCRFCASVAVLPGFNDLATTHPDLAAMWDPGANGNLTPMLVSAGNHVTKVHLRCPHGHEFVRTPVKLVETGGRCQTCQGAVLIPGTNDLATLRPDVAAWWHPTKNGARTPGQIKPLSVAPVYWMCPDGHSFESTPAYLCRQKAITCPADNGRLLVVGLNDLATREPNLVKDWDRERNGFGPDEVVPGDTPRAWTCQYGHTQERTVSSRRRAGGCTLCPPEHRVAAGQRKNTRGRQGWDKRLEALLNAPAPGRKSAPARRQSQ